MYNDAEKIMDVIPMTVIPIQKGLFTLLIFEALVIAIISIAFMVNLFNTYTNLVYRQSAEVLNLHSVITDAKLSEIEGLSFEILSNADIQENLTKYYDSGSSYDTYQAKNDLYTQLFTRCIMNKSIVSISFVFLNGDRVDTGRLQVANVSGEALDRVIEDAILKNGSCGWVANVAGDNIITLYRLIRDISGHNFRPLGTLIVNVAADLLFGYTPIVAENYEPDIFCVAGDQLLSENPTDVSLYDMSAVLNSPNSYDIVRLGNERYFVSTKKLAHNDWTLVYTVSTNDLLRSINSLNFFYTISLLATVFVIVLIGYAFANAISRPLTRLTKAMKMVEAGDYSAALNANGSATQFSVSEVQHLSRGFSRMVERIDHLIREVYAKQLLIMDMKYRILQQQVNPHFLYNTLDTINWKAAETGNREIPMIVKSLSKLLRGSIKGPDIITVKEDLEFVESYIYIQKTRFKERLQFHNQVSPTVYSCKIPRLTLQPIVENSIIHNLEKYSDPCEIWITASAADGILELSVIDNGKGIDLEHVEMILSGAIEAPSKSIGLRNIDQRIKMAFGEQYGIQVSNRIPQGAIITITLPFEGEAHVDGPGS